jgi:hypothetical protein
MTTFIPGFDVSRVRMIEYDMPLIFLGSQPDWMETDSFEYILDLRFTWQFFPEEDEVIVQLMLDVQALDEETGKELGTGKFHLVFFYEVDALSKSVSEEEGILQVEEALGSLLLSLTYSTGRGILITKTQHSSLEDLILPVKSAEELLDSLDDESSDLPPIGLN